MAVLSTVAVLLVINMVLMHADRIVSMYYWSYKKLIKPKFKSGEFVLINNVEYEVISVVKTSKPYTYFCLPKSNQRSSLFRDTYFHESKIKKKTGLLKELE